MTKYPLWKYLIITLAVIIGLVYTIPNFYGEVPAVQISNPHAANSIDTTTLSSIETNLASNDVIPVGEVFDGKTLKLKFNDTDSQLKARDLIQKQLGDNYIVALNLVSTSPNFLTKINANPMFLGLDLRGGVHLLLEIDMNAAVKKTLDKYASDIKRDLRNNQTRFGTVTVDNDSVRVQFRDVEAASTAAILLKKDLPNIALTEDGNGNLEALISPTEMDKIKEVENFKNILT